MTRAQQAEIATKLQTILNNGEYKGTRQTVITRPKIAAIYKA